MATHSSILAWRIPWTEEPVELQFMGSQRIEHCLVNNTFILALQADSLPIELPGKPKQYICIFILKWRKELAKDKSPKNPKLNSRNNFSCMCASLVTQSCPTLCDPMDHSPPGSSVHGILQARILEWIAISFSRRSSPPRDWTCVSGIGRQILYHWATWEVPFLLSPTYNSIAYTLANRKVEEVAYLGPIFLVNKALPASQLVSPLPSTPPPTPPTRSALVPLVYFLFLRYRVCYFPQGLWTSSFISSGPRGDITLSDISPNHTV